MRAYLVFPTLLLCASAVVASGCRDAAGPVDDLRVVATVRPAEFRAGDRVTVTTTVTNAGSRTRRIEDTDGCRDPFTVTGADGTAFPPAYRPCPLIARAPVELAAGAQHVVVTAWRGDVGPTSPEGHGRPLAPGEYLLRAGVYAVVPGPTRVGPTLVPAVAVIVRVLP